MDLQCIPAGKDVSLHHAEFCLLRYAIVMEPQPPSLPYSGGLPIPTLVLLLLNLHSLLTLFVEKRLLLTYL